MRGKKKAMDREPVREAIKKLEDERARLDNERAAIDRAIEALRPLAVDPSPPSPSPHGSKNGAVHNGHTDEPTGQMALVVNMLRKLGEPVSAKSAHLALGKRAPSMQETTNHLLRKATERGFVVRTGKEREYRYAAVVA
jgi:hypothetical protein